MKAFPLSSEGPIRPGSKAAIVDRSVLPCSSLLVAGEAPVRMHCRLFTQVSVGGHRGHFQFFTFISNVVTSSLVKLCLWHKFPEVKVPSCVYLKHESSFQNVLHSHRIRLCAYQQRLRGPIKGLGLYFSLSPSLPDSVSVSLSPNTEPGTYKED